MNVTTVPQGATSTGRIMRTNAYGIKLFIAEMDLLGILPAEFDLNEWAPTSYGDVDVGPAFCNPGQLVQVKRVSCKNPLLCVDPETKVLKSVHVVVNCWKAGRTPMSPSLLNEGYMFALQHAFVTNAPLDLTGKFILDENEVLGLALAAYDCGLGHNVLAKLCQGRAANLAEAAALGDGTPYDMWLVPTQCLDFRGVRSE